MHQAISMHAGSNRFRGFRSIAIANSTHGKYPTGADSWIQHTRDIIFSLTGEKVVLLTSTGSLNWELQCYLAARAGVAQIIILPATRTHFHHRMIECADPYPNTEGSPGPYAYSNGTTPKSKGAEVYFDNIEVLKNE